MNFHLRQRLASTDILHAALAQGRVLPGASFAGSQAEAHVQARHRALASRRFNAQGLLAWLHHSQGDLRLTPEQSRNLAAAGNPQARFLVTGQQPGLLGGPLLAWLKALTAIDLARRQSAVLGLPVIPLFWIAGDDSDLAEANLAEFFWPGDGETPPLRLPFSDPRRKWTVGSRELTQAAAQALAQGLPSAWSSEARALAQSAYVPGGSLVTGFRSVLQACLGETGLLFADGGSPHLRELTAAPLRDILRRAPEFFVALRRAEARLQKDFDIHPQVRLAPKALPAFLLQDGERLRLFSAREEGQGQAICPEATVTAMPPQLAGYSITHDALSRMLVAEAALPILGHVLGPAELRYAAQLAEAMPLFTGGQPLVHPRQSLLLVPGETARRLENDGVADADWPALRPSAWREILKQRDWARHPAARKAPMLWLEDWKELVLNWQGQYFSDQADPAPLFRRIEGALKHYQEGAQESLARKNPLYSEVTSRLRPLAHGHGQDRRVNLLSLVSALGLNGMRDLARNLDATHVGVQIMILDD